MRFFFATEIAALVAHSRLPVNLDRTALRKYLQFGIFPSPDTPFAEIRKVAPGELIQFEPAGVRRKSYWRWQISKTAKSPAFARGVRSNVPRRRRPPERCGRGLWRLPERRH